MSGQKKCALCKKTGKMICIPKMNGHNKSEQFYVHKECAKEFLNKKE
jgi:hypothetical protein